MRPRAPDRNRGAFTRRGPTAAMDRPWVSLFSGGKDSSWALHRALERGLPVEALVTVHPARDSYLYHVPATGLAGLAAESIGLPLIEVSADVPADGPVDAGEQGDRELEPLEDALRAFADDAADRGGLGGVVAGAVESRYQADRLEAMCDRLDAELYAPLWGADPLEAGRAMVDAGFDVRVVRVAADGLDETWLGRRLDRAALDELAALGDARGVHVLGEGGEYETLVVDGPHLSRPLEYEARVEWHGTHGDLVIEDAWLA